MLTQHQSYVPIILFVHCFVQPAWDHLTAAYHSSTGYANAQFKNGPFMVD